jgi:hypothetical protein
VTVDGNDRLINVGDVFLDAANQGAELRRGQVAHGVGDVDGGGPSGDRRFQDLIEKLWIRAPRILWRELHIVGEGLGVGHHLGGDGQHLLTTLAQFVLHVDVGGGDEGVDAALGSGGDRPTRRLNVLFRSSRQAADGGAVGGAHLARDLVHRLKIPRAGKGEPGFDDVHPKSSQLPRDRKLLIHVKGGPGGLFAVPQGGVKDQNAVCWHRGVTHRVHIGIKDKRRKTVTTATILLGLTRGWYALAQNYLRIW